MILKIVHESSVDDTAEVSKLGHRGPTHNPRWHTQFDLESEMNHAGRQLHRCQLPQIGLREFEVRAMSSLPIANSSRAGRLTSHSPRHSSRRATLKRTLGILVVGVFALLSGCGDVMGPATSRSNELYIYNDTGRDIIVVYNWKSDILQNTKFLETGRGDDIQKLPIGETTNAQFRFNIYAARQDPSVRTDSFQKTSGQALEVTCTDMSHETSWGLSSTGNVVNVTNQSSLPRLVVVLVAPSSSGNSSPPSTTEPLDTGDEEEARVRSLREIGGAKVLDVDPPAEMVLIRVEPNSSASESLRLKGPSNTFDFAVTVLDLVKAVDIEQTLVPEEKKKITAIIGADYEMSVREQIRNN